MVGRGFTRRIQIKISGIMRVMEPLMRLMTPKRNAGFVANLNAAGPEVIAFEEMVVAIRDAVRSRARLIHVLPGAVPLLTRGLGLLVGDVLLTRDELAGLLAELVHSEEPSTGEIRFTSWVAEQGHQLGARYASELHRHFRPAAR
jgi:hypothetical protein